jgi:hypothetical protein
MKMITGDIKKFVEAWQKSKSVAEVATRLGLEPSARNKQRLSARAHFCRTKHNVPLKLIGKEGFGWDDVRRLAENALQDDDGSVAIDEKDENYGEGHA